MKFILIFLLLTTTVQSQTYFEAALKIKDLTQHRESAFELAENISSYGVHAEMCVARKISFNERLFLSCVLNLYGLEITKRVAHGVQFYDLPRIQHELITQKAHNRFKKDFGGNNYPELVEYLIKIYRSNEV